MTSRSKPVPPALCCGCASGRDDPMSGESKGLGIEWGVATSTMAGEKRSGDQYIVRETSAGSLIAVVDGIGHGDAAAEASTRALEVLTSSIGAGVIPAVRRSHEALIGTRG